MDTRKLLTGFFILTETKKLLAGFGYSNIDCRRLTTPDVALTWKNWVIVVLLPTMKN